MKDNISENVRQFYMPVILTILTIILGYLSFHFVFPDYPFFRKLYYTFQLFTMESGDRFYENGIQSIPVTVIFNLARFSAIAAVFSTIVIAILSVLQYKLFLNLIRFMRGHTILCGLGDIGKAVSDNFKNKRKLIIIEKDASNEYLVSLKKKGARIIDANALDISVLEKLGIHNAACLLALTGDDFDNLTIIRQAVEIVRKKTSAVKDVKLIANINSRNLKAAVIEEWQDKAEFSGCILKKRLNQFYTIANEKLNNAGGQIPEDPGSRYIAAKEALSGYDPVMDSPEINLGNIMLLNINQMAGRYIFLNFPPDRFRPITKTGDKAMNILMLGYSNIGEEILKSCIRNCHYINRKNTRITLITVDGDIILEKLRSKFRNISRIIDLDVINLNPHHITNKFMNENDLQDVDIVYICSPEDNYQASYSSKARELFGENMPIVRPFYKKHLLCNVENAGNTYSFNIFNKVANMKSIVDESLDRKAIAVHNQWIMQAIPLYIEEVEKCLSNNQSIPRPKTTLAPWHFVDEEIRDNNRSVIDHINVKLRSMGQLRDPDQYNHPELANIDYSFLQDDDKVEQLAEIEHRRWMATKYICGWINKEPRNDLEKRHDCLVDFDALKEGIKNIDRQQIRKMEQIIEL